MAFVKIVIRMTLIILVVNECNCLKNVRLKIPEAAVRNKKVVLECDYELEDHRTYHEELYQVKWHRAEMEFCRYEPRSVPPLKIFPIPGIEVVRDETTGGNLTIIPRNRSTAEGMYMCEVTADWPSFDTQVVQAHMFIVDVPNDYPNLTGLNEKYKIGSKLYANCSSEGTFPAANITFYVNDREVRHHIYRQVSVITGNGLMNSFSFMRFTVQRHHLREDKRIRVKCVAYIYSAYWQSNEKSVILDYKPPTTTEAPWNPRKAYTFNKPKSTLATLNTATDSSFVNGSVVNLLIFIISITLLLPSVLK